MVLMLVLRCRQPCIAAPPRRKATTLRKAENRAVHDGRVEDHGGLRGVDADAGCRSTARDADDRHAANLRELDAGKGEYDAPLEVKKLDNC